MSALKTVEALKNAGEDYEWYPTTNEILEAMYWDIKSQNKNVYFESTSSSRKHLKYDYQSISMLDIGAGNCKLLTKFKEMSESLIEEDSHGNPMNGNQIGFSKYMAIEKSNILIESMPSDVFIVGTDFHQNTLIDKKADVVFCNPPYSEYAQWSEKIINESNAKVIYLVIPKRWGNNRGMAHAIKQRRAKVTIVGDFDFVNSEDRKARAYVSLVKIDLKGKDKYAHRRDEAAVDPFELWFSSEFKLNTNKKSLHDHEVERAKAKTRKETLEKTLVDAPSLVDALVKLYNDELLHLINNYKKVSELDSEILKELNVDIEGVMKAFQSKIENLKSFYWREVFENLSEIKARLTSRSRTSLVNKLLANTNIDFTQSNIRSILIWVIKNANKYFDEQMLEVYDDFTTVEGIKMYKSNSHWEKDTWRYARDLHEKGIKYALDYRIVLHGYGDHFDKSGFINTKQLQYIDDLVIIAKNLGFKIDMDSINNKLETGEKGNIYTFVPLDRKLKKGQKTHFGKIEEVYELEEGGSQGKYQYQIDGNYTHYSSVKIDEDIFTTNKVYKNGNIHFQLNQNFIKKLNLEVSRLRGWIKSPKEAAQEFDISEEEANDFWRSSYILLPTSLNALLPSSVKQFIEIEGNDVEISFKPDNTVLHTGDMVEYKDEWVEVSCSTNGDYMCLYGEHTKHFTLAILDTLGDITAHKSNVDRVEAIGESILQNCSSEMTLREQRKILLADDNLSDYELHAFIFSYVYYIYNLKFKELEMFIVDKAKEPVDVKLTVSNAEKIYSDDILNAHAGGKLF